MPKRLLSFLRSPFAASLLAIFLPAVAVLIVRLPYFGYTILNEDEGLYAAVARAMQAGGLPYRDGWDHAAPGIFYLYWALFAAFGKWNLLAVRWAAFLAHLASSLIIGNEIKRRHGAVSGILSGTLAAVVLGAYLDLDMIAALTESFLLPFLLGGVALLLRWVEGEKPHPLWIGILFACAVWFKIHALFIELVLLFVVWGVRVLNGEPETKSIVPLLSTFAAMATAMFLLLSPIILGGGFRDYLQMYIHYNLFYLGAGSYDTFFLNGLIRTFWQWGLPNFLTMALAVVALSGRWRNKDSWNGRQIVLATGLIIGILLGIMGARLFGHYFIPAAAFAAWLAAEGIARIVASVRVNISERREIIIGLSLLFFAGLVVPIERFHAEAWGSDSAKRCAQFNDPYPRLRSLVQSTTQPDETIWIWGFAPEFYTLFQRDCSNRFINANYLVGLVPWVNVAPDEDTSDLIVKGSWSTLLHDFSRKLPALIIDTSSANYRYWGKYPIRGSRPLVEMLQKRYVNLGYYDGFQVYLLDDLAEKFDIDTKNTQTN